MNVFISQPMDGLTNDEIKERRLELLETNMKTSVQLTTPQMVHR